MGDPIGTPKVDQTSFEYTATRSIFTQEVNNAVQLTVTFLSPLTPDDFTRASLVSSYMNVDVASLDGKSHKVELYTDITAGRSLNLHAIINTLTYDLRMGIWGQVNHSPMGL